MEFQEFMRQLLDAGRYKHDQNLMDRKVFIEVNGKDVEIEDITIDYKGDVCISVSIEEDEPQ